MTRHCGERRPQVPHRVLRSRGQHGLGLGRPSALPTTKPDGQPCSRALDASPKKRKSYMTYAGTRTLSAKRCHTNVPVLGAQRAALLLAIGEGAKVKDAVAGLQQVGQLVNG